jgi:hypothetical protein
MTRLNALWPLSPSAGAAWGFSIGLATSLAGGFVYLHGGTVALAVVTGLLVLTLSELVLVLGLGTLHLGRRR